MNITLLIIHGLLAVMLLGAITHQSFNTVWPRRPGERSRSPPSTATTPERGS